MALRTLGLVNRSSHRLFMEQLEDRTVPALFLQLDAFGNLVGIVGVPTAPGDVTLDFVADDTVDVIENGSSLGVYSVPGNLSISLGNTILADPDLTIDLGGNSFSSSLSINLGNSNIGAPGAGYDVLFTAGSIAGNVTLRSGNGSDSINLGADLLVAGSMSLNVSAGTDLVRAGNGTVISGNLTLNGVDAFLFGAAGGTTTNVGGNLQFNNSRERNGSVFTLNDGTIGGILTFTGGSGVDNITLAMTINGSAYFNVGQGNNLVSLADPAGVILGNFVYVGGNGTDGLNLNGRVLGNVTANLNGGNDSIIFATSSQVLGSQITIIGGNGNDTVTFGGTAIGARLSAFLGNGNDVFNLDSLGLKSALIDYGFGVNSFTQSVGAIPFPITHRNLP